MQNIKSEFLTVQTSTKGTKCENTVELRLAPPANTDQSETLVLFLPFMGGSARTYDHVISSLSKKHPNFAYLAISYPGTGGTPPPTPENDQPEMCSIIPRAEQVLGVLRSPRVAEFWTGVRKLVVVAQSMSAKVTYVLLDMLAKGKSGAGADSDITVTSVVLLGPAPIGPLHFPPEMREQQLHAYDSLDSAKWVVENVLSYRKLNSESVDALANDCVRTSAGAQAGWMYHGMVFDCSDYISRLVTNWPAIQIRVVMGEHDRVESVVNVRKQTVMVLKDLGVNVSETVVKDSGHLLPVEVVDDVVSEVTSLIINSEISRPLGT